MGVTVKDDRRRWDRLRRVLKDANSAVEVGVRGDGKERQGAGPSNVQLATIHEFGLTISYQDRPDVVIPQRSFIRSTADDNLRKYRALLKRVGGQVVAGDLKLDQAMDLVGLKVAADMRAKIRNGIPPANADATIARKGSSKPLIDTGQLLGSITHKVVKA